MRKKPPSGIQTHPNSINKIKNSKKKFDKQAEYYIYFPKRLSNFYFFFFSSFIYTFPRGWFFFVTEDAKKNFLYVQVNVV